jgi:hypothetical protein
MLKGSASLSHPETGFCKTTMNLKLSHSIASNGFQLYAVVVFIVLMRTMA